MQRSKTLTQKNAEASNNQNVMPYTDYSNVTDNKLKDKGIIATIVSNKATTNFPVKLHYMLSELEKDGLDDIISWQPHGRCFVIHKQQELVDKILPL